MDPAVDYVPVLGLLERASNELEVGQLIHTSVFSLFEAMSAVEIGNPRMDAGARPKGDATPLEQRQLQLNLSPAQLLGVMDHLLCLEATWHNGGSLARTVYSSLYMMQPQRTASNQVLSAFARALEAMCVEVNHLIMTGCVCEEEDFNAHIAGLPLEHATTTAGAAASGMSQPAHPSNSSSGGSSSSSSNKQDSATSSAAATDKLFAALSQAVDAQDLSLKQRQQRSPETAAAAAAAAAVAARLQFRKLLLQGLIKLKRRQKQDLDQAAKLFVKAQGELASINGSLGLAQDHGLGWDENINSHLIPAVPPRAVQVFTPTKAVEYFESLLCQLLKVTTVTPVSSYQALKDFILAFNVQPACPIARSALHIQVSYNAWVPPPPPEPSTAASANSSGSSNSNTADGSSGSQKQQQPASSQQAVPAVAPPSAANGPVADGNRAAAAAATVAALEAAIPVWGLSPRMVRAALQLSPGDDLGDEGDLFLEQAVIAIGNTIQALLMNHSRCRRRLRRGLEDYGNLYQHALNADTSEAFQAYMTTHGWLWRNEHPDDPAGPLAVWVECETCFCMLHYLLMGFELQLYEPADYAMVYWYIDMLCINQQQASKQLHEQRPATTTNTVSSSGNSNPSSANGAAAGPRLPFRNSSSGGSSKTSKSGSSSSSSKGNDKQPAADTNKQQPVLHITLQHLIMEVWKHLSVGALRVVMTLPMLGMYKPPELLFNTEAQRFDQRFASFHALQRPEPLGYDLFVESTSVKGVSPEQLLMLAYDSFKKAQQACAVIKGQAIPWNATKQQLADLAPLEKVAASNALAVMLLSRVATGSQAAAASQLKPQFTFGLNKWFPALTLKSAAASGAGAGK